MRRLDAISYLPGSVLAKVDRMSMRFALEVRCRLLDVDVASLAAGLRPEDCVSPADDTSATSHRAFAGKRILRDVLARDLPRGWVARRKSGFGLPETFWHGRELRDFAHDLLDSPSSRIHALVDRDALRTWLLTQGDPASFRFIAFGPC